MIEVSIEKNIMRIGNKNRIGDHQNGTAASQIYYLIPACR